MKTIFIIIIGILSVGHLKAEEFVLQKMSKSPLIDGKIAAQEWNSARQFKLQDYKGRKSNNPTIVYLDYDNQNLYVAFKCNEPRMDKLKTTYFHAEEHDNSIWQDDCVEIFIAPWTGLSRPYYQFVINSAGVSYDAFAGNPFWDCKFERKVHKSTDGWSIELAIPFENFGFTPKGGESWLFAFSRQAKTDKRIYAMPGTGAVNDPSRFIPVVFNNADVRLDAVKWHDKKQLMIVNNKNENLKLNLTLENNKEETDFSVDVALKKGNNTIPYKGTNQSCYMNLKVLAGNSVIYQNRIELPEEAAPRTFKRITAPLYQSLLSNNPPGLAKEGAIFWFSGGVGGLYKRTRIMALQYGLKFVFDGYVKLLFDNKLHPIYQMVNSLGPELLKHKVRIVARPRVTKFPENNKKYYFLPHTVCRENFLEQTRNYLNKNKEIIWAVFFGDETCSYTERRGITIFEKYRDRFGYIKKLDEKIKTNYGKGKYGIPLSLNDSNPFRWIAYRSWLNDQLVNLHQELYTLVKNTDKNIHVISDDPSDRDKVYDFTTLNGKCDIITHQLYPSPLVPRMGYLTKLITDLSEVKEIWPVPHIEEYGMSLTPAEVLAYISRVIKNGGTGLHYYLADTRGRRAKKKYLCMELFGAPERWQTEMNIAEHLRKMNKLSFPTPDCAIFYSVITARAYPHFNYSNANLAAYSLLGPVNGCWFKFLNENLLEKHKESLHKFKVIFVPDARYLPEKSASILTSYVKNGGTLVTFDPMIFSRTPYNEDISGMREFLFGVKSDGQIASRTFQFRGSKIPFPVQGIKISRKGLVQVLGTYNDNSPCITEKHLGRGRAIYFAFNPLLVQKNVSNHELQKFFSLLLKYLNLQTAQKIWRFELPKSLIGKFPEPEGQCLTGNAVLWRQFKPVTDFNNNCGGLYSYSRIPDVIADQGGVSNISFDKGDLTDRRKAPAAGNVDLGIGKIQDWVVGWKTDKEMNIIFDLKKAYSLKYLKIFYKGIMPPLTLMLSVDGKKWSEVKSKTDAGDKDFIHDVKEKTINLPEGPFQFIKIRFGTVKKCRLIISEMEIWK